MENEQTSHAESPQKSPQRSWRRLLFSLLIAIVVLVVVAVGYTLISQHISTSKDSSKAEKVLTLKDLDNPKVAVTGQTSTASVENLTKESKAEIDKQIAAKENPIDTVKQLAGVLLNTTTATRQDQLSNFLEDFLANHEKELWLEHDSEMPDQAQVNYWKAQLYAYLIHNFRSMMDAKFTDSAGKPIDTTKEQLKYINLYLALANDPASHPAIPEADKDIFPGYVYAEAKNFSELKDSLTKGAE